MDLRHRAELALELATNRRGRRAEVSRELFFHAARRFTPAIVAPTDYGPMYVSTSDLYVGAQLFIRREANADSIQAALEVFESHGTHIGRGLMIEIGANIGSTTVPAVKRSGFERIVAIEPLPANVDLLRQNLTANRVAHHVDVLPIGLSSEDGSMALLISAGNSGDNRLVNDATVSASGEFGEDRRETVEVAVRSWDSLVSEGAWSLDDVDLVWIDVQGHEGQVLSGAATLLERRLPVVMEFWPYGLRRAGGLELVERLVGKNYERMVDMHAPPDGTPSKSIPTSEIGKVLARTAGIEHTDLLLLPG